MKDSVLRLIQLQKGVKEFKAEGNNQKTHLTPLQNSHADSAAITEKHTYVAWKKDHKEKQYLYAI